MARSTVSMVRWMSGMFCCTHFRMTPNCWVMKATLSRIKFATKGTTVWMMFRIMSIALVIAGPSVSNSLTTTGMACLTMAWKFAIVAWTVFCISGNTDLKIAPTVWMCLMSTC